MTEDDKKKAIAEAASPATDVDRKTAEEGMKRMLLSTVLIDAVQELAAALEQGRPLVISYRVPCPCGEEKCTTKLAIQISPYTSVYYDALRSKH